MNQRINNFFIERKAAWLKSRLTVSLSDEEKVQIQREADEKFSLSNWLPDAAKRAAQLTMVSHPSKFSHPSAKTSSVIAQSNQADDGYLRSGNVDYELDVFGNAAAMDVYKFLSLLMDDNRTVLAHIEEDSAEIKRLLTISTSSYETIRNGLISIKQLDDSNKTDHLVKQVYFPVDNDYHLLSLLTPSGLLTQVKTRIDNMRFSEETKEAKEYRKKNAYHATGFDDVFDLTITAFGGTQPQNVSVLNSQNAGRAYLLPSCPPVLTRRKVRLPTTNFFKNSLYTKSFQDAFQSLDKLIKADINNLAIRQGIQNNLKYIIEQVLHQVFTIRQYPLGWSKSDYYQSLPYAQRIWLDDIYEEQRENQADWLDEIVREFANWILDTYEYLCKDTVTKLSDFELREVRQIVKQVIQKDQEFLK